MTASPPISKARLEALSDGIYAVVLTLLVLELKLPPLPEASGSALNAALLALLPKGLVWMLSFWVAALFWLAQGRVLRQSGEPDRLALLIELSWRGVALQWSAESWRLVLGYRSWPAPAYARAAPFILTARGAPVPADAAPVLETRQYGLFRRAGASAGCG